MKSPVHVTLRALAFLRGSRDPSIRANALFCAATDATEGSLAALLDAEYCLAGKPGWRMPTCPACAVAWDEALSQRC